MENTPSTHLLRIYVDESDKVKGKLLYETIVIAAKEEGLAGATVLRGILGFGASSVLHRAHLLEISSDLPMIIEMVDETKKIRKFIESVKGLLDQAGTGGLITMEKVEVFAYRARGAE